MPNSPTDGPQKFERGPLRQPPKKSSSPIFKIVLAVLGCGFLVVACCVGWFGYAFVSGIKQGVENARNRQADPAVNAAYIASGEPAFKAANSQIGSKSGSAARGNSDVAVKLAEKFSGDIGTLREAFFTKRRKKPLFSLSDGEFLTYCRLDNESCVFLVHVPDLRKFSKEAKVDLADLAWSTAQDVVRANLDDPPPKLAVGLRGVMFYDSALVGKFQPEEGGGDGIQARQSGDSPEKLLYSFFKADAVAPGAAADTGDAPVTEEMPEEDTPADSKDDGAR